MKALVLVMSLLMTSSVKAEEVTIQYPIKDCATVVGSDFSTPTSDSMYYIFELHCKSESGFSQIFITSWASTGSFLGFGRATVPDKIILIPSPNVEGLVVD